MKHLALIALLVTVGCATQPTVHGVPNFGIVVPARDGQPEIDRGGQPNAEGWVWLKNSRGITDDIELNAGEDSEAAEIGITVHRFPISTWQQITGSGVGETLSKAEREIRPGTFFHCTHGKNRTGSLAMIYRTRHGWPQWLTEAEAKHFGWGDSLPGLKWWWGNLPR